MRIGIIGAGRRTKAVLEALNKTSHSKCTALLCRSQSIKKAEDLKGRYSIEKIYTSEEQFLNSGDFDLVYVSVVNSLHYSFTKNALNKGFNVACEKPFTSTAKEAEELIVLAKSNNLFLFETVTLRYSDNFEAIKDELPNLGNIKLVQYNFSQYSSKYENYLSRDVTPAFDPKLSGGCLYDLGVYSVHFVVGLFGMPTKIEYYPNFGYNGIDTSGCLILKYDNFLAVLTTAKDSSSPFLGLIQGDKGYIQIDEAPSRLKKISLHIYSGESRTIDKNTASDDPLVDVFNKIDHTIAKGDNSRCYALLDDSLKVMHILESARISGGLKFVK